MKQDTSSDDNTNIDTENYEEVDQFKYNIYDPNNFNIMSSTPSSRNQIYDPNISKINLSSATPQDKSIVYKVHYKY